MNALSRLLSAPDAILREKIVEAMVFLRSHSPDLRSKSSTVNRQIRAEVVRYLRALADLWVVGPGPEPKRDPLVFSMWLGTDFALGRYTRLTVGVVYYNADQHRTVAERDADGFGRFKRVRSHDVYPTFDLIWAWSL